MAAPNLTAMRRTLAELGDYLEQAISITAESQNPETPTSPASLDCEQGIVRSYIELARGALERFEEAAHGA